MNVNITGKHYDLTPEIKSYIEEEMDKLEKYEKNILDSSFTIALNDKRYFVEGNIHVKKHRFYASDESFDLITSIDSTIRKLKKQLVKYEKKIHEHRQ
ncbi:MAG: ribosome-associated translation inhibitor RaiA [bacterium]